MGLGISYKHFDFAGTCDTIVIGSGIGGLASAALLARVAGERVLILERHYTPGGFTHAFKRPGFEWDVGVHYVGDVGEPGMSMRHAFDYFSDGKLAWADMGDVYDVIEIEGRRYEFPKGRDAFRARLQRYFPDERWAIDRYLREIDRAVAASQLYFAEKALPPPLQRVLGPVLRWRALRYARRTTGEVLSELTQNRELRAVLAGQWGDYGLPPAQGSFLMHATIAKHYQNGAAYPVGGASRIAETIMPAIAARGGALLIRAEVEQLLIEDGRAAGVRMADGREIRAGNVISDAGAAMTFGRLLPAQLRAASPIAKAVAEVGPSCAHISLYVGLDCSAAALALPKMNRWIYPGPDHDGNVAAFAADPEAPLPAAFISFPSAKDPDFERRHPGHATIEVVSFAPWSWFERWRDSHWGRRDEGYAAFKRRLAQRLQDALETACPSVRGHIQHAELSTPLSTRHFAGHPHGEIYGLAHNPARFEARALQPRTEIPGLYLTGADVCSAGISGALMGGVLTASVVLKRNLIGLVMAGYAPSATPAVEQAA